MLLNCGVERTLESPLDCKEIQPVHHKGDQSWVYIERTDVEAETPILWPPDVKSWRIWKDPDAGRDWGQEEKRMTEDEMVGWHHRLDGHGFGWTPEVGDGQEGLACCGSWGLKELNMTEWLNWTELKNYITPLLTLERRALSTSLLRGIPPSHVRNFLNPFSRFNKTLLHKSSWVIKPGPWSQS